MEPTGGDDFDRLMQRLAAKDIRFRRLHGRPEQQTSAFDCTLLKRVVPFLGKGVQESRGIQR